MKNYHVAILTKDYGIHLVLVQFHDKITMSNLKEFTDKCVIAVCNQAQIELLSKDANILSWQEIEPE